MARLMPNPNETLEQAVARRFATLNQVAQAYRDGKFFFSTEQLHVLSPCDVAEKPDMDLTGYEMYRIEEIELWIESREWSVPQVRVHVRRRMSDELGIVLFLAERRLGIGDDRLYRALRTFTK